MVNVRCALRLRCRGPRAGRPGGPGICTPGRAPGSVPSLVAPLSLSLSRPAFPRAGTASRLKRRALERASSSVAVLAVAPPWHHPLGAQVPVRGPVGGAGGPVALEMHADCAGRAWRQGLGLVPPSRVAWGGRGAAFERGLGV